MRALCIAWLLVFGARSFSQEPALSRLALEDRAEDARLLITDPLLPTEPAQSFRSDSPQGPDWDSDPGVIDQAPEVGSQIQIRPRGGTESNIRSFTRGRESVFIINTPTQVNIFGDEGIVEITADRIVAWTEKGAAGLSGIGAGNAPVEFYLEGNIEFRQGRQAIFAERMYYDVRRQNGVILEAELFADAGREYDEYQTPFRVKADVLRQFSPTVFQANNAAFTTSRMGIPRYWIQSDSLNFDTGTTPLIPQQSRLEGLPGDASRFDRLQVTSENTRLFVGGVPLFRWPRFSTDLARNPSLYLDRIRVGNDGVFGSQLLTSWNMHQILGLTAPENTKWTSNLDYLSKRGIGFGTDLEYQRDAFFGRPALGFGKFNSWFINDKGTDNLGFDRRDVPLEKDFRGRARFQDRRFFPSAFQLTTELGWISDRNFLEQYLEEEADLEKDQDTSIELKKYNGSGSWSVGAGLRLNDFLTQTEWLPRFDHYQLGQSLLQNRLTRFGHTQIGYGRLRTAEAPTNLVDAAKFDPLAWERDVEGMRLATRQEIDMPMQLGALKVVPFALGEVAHWQQDLNQNELTRLLGQAGVRASVPFWRVDPTLQNELFNLNGLAHKMVLGGEFLWADASESYTQLPLYDALDDDAVEFARRRFLFDTFGQTFGTDVALRHDERNFALRSGMQRSVTAQSTEIADDLMMGRISLRNRWQTKRGVPGRYRIVDVLTLDFETTIFPKADRDNFGETLGPTTYDMRWHVGDRTTVLSDGYFDYFDEGLQTVSLGVALTRPRRSQYYVGIRSIEGPISSNVLTSAASYRLSPKWILNYASTVDFSETGNIGQSGSIVRVGESLLVSFGAHYDASRNNFGFKFDVVPRFVRSSRGRIGGGYIAPTGAHGFE